MEIESDDDVKLVLSELCSSDDLDNVEDAEECDFMDFSDLYDEYEDEIGTVPSDEEFDKTVFNIGSQSSTQPIYNQPTNNIHSFDELIQFTLDTCERLKSECPHDINRINCWVANCNQQYLKPQYVNMSTPVISTSATTNVESQTKFTPQTGFQPLQVEMVSYDRDGNAKKVDVGTPGEASIEDVCTVCADDEF